MSRRREQLIERLIAWLAGVFGVALPILVWIHNDWFWLLKGSIAAGAVCLALSVWLVVESRRKRRRIDGAGV